ncbi:protein NO VEIN domain-containing protein [Mesorhizobium sp. A623]
MQGTRAFGCDYLTFDSEEDRATFRKNPGRIDLVSRFIETKSGAVRFSDNEWLAANNLGERYFIYRISFSEGGRHQAQLTVVRNPSARGEAIRTDRELLVDKVNGREEFDLVVVESPGEEQPEAHAAAVSLV